MRPSNIKTIVWRFDDLCFDHHSEFYIKPKLLKRLATIFYKNNLHVTFSLIVTHEDTFSKEAKENIAFLKKQGHEIVAHGAPHVNWQTLSIKNIKKAIILMRKNLFLLGITTAVFVFPGLHACHAAYPFLKKKGFTVILKGTRFFGFSKYVDSYYQRKLGITFFPENHWTTHTTKFTLKTINKFYSFLGRKKRFLHVMDHLWLYKNNSLKDLEEFISETNSFRRYLTMTEFLKTQKKTKSDDHSWRVKHNKNAKNN